MGRELSRWQTERRLGWAQNQLGRTAAFRDAHRKRLQRDLASAREQLDRVIRSIRMVKFEMPPGIDTQGIEHRLLGELTVATAYVEDLERCLREEMTVFTRRVG